MVDTAHDIAYCYRKEDEYFLTEAPTSLAFDGPSEVSAL
jgi:hypothetical protein